MKKFIAIAVVGMFGVLSLGSCKKDYTCECTQTGSTVVNKIEIKDQKKKDAEKSCEAVNSTSYGIWTCKLK